MTATWQERRAVPLGAQSLVQAGALLRTWSRDPGIVVQSLVFPAFMLLMFQLVLGETVTTMGGGDSVYGNTGATAITLIHERDTGLLARMWTLPVPRAGFIAGRLLAEAVRAGLATLVLFAVAVPLGFRFEHGPLAGIGAVLVPMIFGVGIAVPVLALATLASGKGAVQQLGGLFLLLLFFNGGFAPVDQYWGWIQPFVRHQPMTPAIDAVRGLTEGGPVLAPLLTTVLWTVGLIAVFGPIAVRGYRRAAEQR